MSQSRSMDMHAFWSFRIFLEVFKLEVSEKTINLMLHVRNLKNISDY